MDGDELIITDVPQPREFRVYGWRKILPELPTDLREEIEAGIVNLKSTDGFEIDTFGEEADIVDGLARKYELDANTLDPEQFGGRPINRK